MTCVNQLEGVRGCRGVVLARAVAAAASVSHFNRRTKENNMLRLITAAVLALSLPLAAGSRWAALSAPPGFSPE